MLAVVGDHLGGHALQARVEEHVHQQGFQDVVAVVTQGNLGAAQFLGHAVQNATAQARAQAAGGLALGDDLLDHAVGVLLFDAEGHAHLGEVLGQHMLGEPRLLLVKVDRHQFEVDGRPALQVHQDVEHGVAVLATRHAHHDLVTLFDHVEVGDGLTHLAVQALAELVHLEGMALGRLELFFTRGVWLGSLVQDLGRDSVVHPSIFADWRGLRHPRRRLAPSGRGRPDPERVPA